MSIFGGSAWELDEASGQYFLHNFEAAQPDLNWWNEDVRREFDDIVRYWWDRGVAGFRIDVCNMMIKDKELRDNPPATEDDPLDQQFMGVRAVYNTDRPEAHDILRRWRAIADTYEPERLLIGETNVEQLPTLMEFYGNGHDELHGGFNFVFINAPFEAAALRAVVEDTEALLPEGAWPIWTASNHDVSRLATRWAAGDPARVKVALLILLTLRGTPFLYQGDEIGLVDGPIEKEDVLDAVGRGSGPTTRAATPSARPCPGTVGPGAGSPRRASAPGCPWPTRRRATWPIRTATPARSSSCAAGPSRPAGPARTWPSGPTGRSRRPTAPGPTPGRGSHRAAQHDAPVRRASTAYRDGDREHRAGAGRVERRGRRHPGAVERRRGDRCRAR